MTPKYTLFSVSFLRSTPSIPLHKIRLFRARRSRREFRHQLVNEIARPRNRGKVDRARELRGDGAGVEEGKRGKLLEQRAVGGRLRGGLRGKTRLQRLQELAQGSETGVVGAIERAEEIQLQQQLRAAHELRLQHQTLHRRQRQRLRRQTGRQRWCGVAREDGHQRTWNVGVLGEMSEERLRSERR